MDKTKVIVGLGSCGIAAGGNKVYNKIRDLKNAENLDFILDKTSCVGMCFREPLVEIIDETGSYLYGEIDENKAVEIINQHIQNHNPVKDLIVKSDYFETADSYFFEGQVKIALRDCGFINPERIEEYEERDGYKALRNIKEKGIPSEEIVQNVLDSGIRGRGGGGFSTGMKWRFALNNQSDEKYVICNADEGDRAEYPLAIQRLNIALEQARQRCFLGDNILGIKGFNLDIYVKEGAGAFVCGEETALMASVEGKRGMPSKRPPFPAEAGLWGKPSNINNVETYANIPWIIFNGPQEYAKYGTEKSKGTKVFALTGKINNGGLVEVPMGISIRDVIYKLGGGIQDNKRFKAVQLGGPSGGCIPEHLIDTKIDYDSVNATGAIMGSGGMVVMDETTCMVDMARFFLDFTQKESCGKCTFCRIGTKRMLEILTRICEGEGKEGDIELLEELAYQIKDSSLCGLGQTAPNPVLTTIRYFRNEYEAHINDKKCPAKTCKPLLTYTVIEENCTGCTVCAKNCPVDTIIGGRKEPHVIIQDGCIKCGICFTKCKFDAILVS